MSLSLGCLGFFSAAPSTLTSAPDGKGLAPAPLTQALTCDQVHRIATWSLGRYGGPGAVRPEDREFRDRALKRFLDRVDSQKLFLTRAEAEAFLKEGGRAWTSLVRDKESRESCAFFESWMRETYPKAVGRFHARLEGIPVESHISGTAPSDADLSEVKLPVPGQFAADETELKRRLQEWVKKLGENATPQLLSAYGGNERALVSDVLRQTFFNEPLDAGSLLTKAILGALDPYSTYFTASEFEDFYEDLAGGTSGIGIKVREVPEGFLIEKILAGTPADRSRKLRVGDTITSVDGKRVARTPHEIAKKLLKGPENSEVHLTVRRAAGEKKLGTRTFTLVLKRERFAFDESRIQLRMKASRRGAKPVAVINVPSFYGRGGMDPLEDERSSSEDLARLLQTLKKKKPSALVLDLRGNPGGFLEEAVAMAGLFLGDKPIVEVVEKKEHRILRDFRHPEPVYDGPLLVLIDESTASASEVLAGALKDYGRAIVVGSPRSYGKGLVQRLFHLDQELFPLSPAKSVGVVKLTTSVYYSPSGHTPANGGITPHIALPEPKPALETAAAGRPVAEEVPFREETVRPASELVREELMKNNLLELSRKSQARTALAKKGLSDEEELKEAISIAVDYSDLERRLAPQVAQSDEKRARE